MNNEILIVITKLLEIYIHPLRKGANLKFSFAVSLFATCRVHIGRYRSCMALLSSSIRHHDFLVGSNKTVLLIGCGSLREKEAQEIHSSREHQYEWYACAWPELLCEAFGKCHQGIASRKNAMDPLSCNVQWAFLWNSSNRILFIFSFTRCFICSMCVHGNGHCQFRMTQQYQLQRPRPFTGSKVVVLNSWFLN